MELLEQIAEELELGDDEKVAELTNAALAQNIPPQVILDGGLIEGMNRIGVKFRNHEIFLPDVLMAAKAMYAGMDLLKPLLMAGGIKSQGTIVLGTVQGDLHDIGKNLVSIMLRGAGFEVVDLGIDVTPQKFVDAIGEFGAQIIGMSALLTTTMQVMKEVIDLVNSSGLGDKVKIIVGGAPVTHQYAQEIGASAYSYDAANAVEVVKSLLGA